MSLVKLQQFYLKDGVTPSIKEFMEQQVFSGKDLSAFQDKKKAYLQLTHDCRDSVRESGKSLGFDLSNRIPPDERIHFLSGTEYEKLNDATLKYSEPTWGFVDWNSFHLFINISGFKDPRSKRTTASIARSLTHELWHSVCYIELGIDKSNTLYIKKRGLRLTKKANDVLLFEEALIEILTLSTIKHNWEKYPRLNNFTNDYQSKLQPSYYSEVIILDALLEKLSEISEDNYIDLVKVLAKDYLTGTEEFKQLVINNLGKQEWSILWTLKKINPEDIAETLKKLELYEHAVRWKKKKDADSYKYCRYL